MRNANARHTHKTSCNRTNAIKYGTVQIHMLLHDRHVCVAHVIEG